jgi:ubiquinone/menaquinone biosynthesis C-methylase UbiE
MKKVMDSRLEQQENVNVYFQSQSSYWRDVYAIGGVQAEIIRDRHATVLDWIDSLALAAGSQVLEIGCGAGFMAIALAQRGFRVHAIDSTGAMVEQARRNAAESGTAGLLSLEVGDVYSLAFGDGSFDLVVAIGVIPWLERALSAIQEVARVTKPGGYVILTTANRAGIASLLDPLVSPVLAPLKLRVKNVFVRVGLRQQTPSMSFHSRRFIDKALASLGLVKTKGMTRGFGFSFFRRSILPEPLCTSLHHRLQRLADRGVPGFRSIGMAYLVLARKSVPQSRSAMQSTSTGK